MRYPTITDEKLAVDATEEVMGFSLKIGVVLSALVGIWGLTCLIAGLLNAGPLDMLRGYFTAITGI